MRVRVCLKAVFSPTEALSEEERQSRQVQTSNTPTFPQHTRGRPAGSAPARPASSADGPVCVVSGSDVAARRSAAALPALIAHTVCLHAQVWLTERSDAAAASVLTGSGRRVSSFEQLHKETAWEEVTGKQGGGRSSALPHPRDLGAPGRKARMENQALGWAVPSSTFCLVHAPFFFAWDFSWLKLLWRFDGSTISTDSTLGLDQQADDEWAGSHGSETDALDVHARNSCFRETLKKKGRREAARKARHHGGCLKRSLSCSTLVMSSVSALLWCFSSFYHPRGSSHQNKERAHYTKYTCCKKSKPSKWMVLLDSVSMYD